MRHIEATNFPAFDACRDFLRSVGHVPISPADHDREIDPICETRLGFNEGKLDASSPLDFHELMVWDLEQVIHADGIVLLPGWERSTGAGYELSAARGTGKRVFYYYPRVDAPIWEGALLREEKPPTIIGLSGYAQAGKDTVGSILGESAGFVRVAFADALRDVLYTLNPLVRGVGKASGTIVTAPIQTFVDGYGWEYAKANTQARELLQRLGTEAGRAVLGDDIWVRTALRKVTPGGRFVFTDVRFPNEAQAIKDMGGEVWRIERAGCDAVNAHASETALDDWAFDYVVFNKGTIEDLAEQVRQIAG